jgi:hypothetical protein
MRSPAATSELNSSDTPSTGNHNMEDFRSKRRALPPETFAIAPEVEPEPSNPIDEDTWASLVYLPDDVSIRTSNYHGTLLKHANDAWGWWVSLVLDIQSLLDVRTKDPLSLSSILVTDELQASIFTMMTGFYRQSISALRSAVEALVRGIYFHLFPDPRMFKRWADGDLGEQVSFDRARSRLARTEPFSLFNNVPGEITSLMKQDGWVDFLYRTFSGFSHGRPFYVNRFGDRIPAMNIELWGGSNGPIYKEGSVRLWNAYYFDVCLFALLLVGLAEPRLIEFAEPEDIPYSVFLDRLLTYHLYPLPLARAMARHLLSR